jgi:hypothetical protein
MVVIVVKHVTSARLDLKHFASIRSLQQAISTDAITRLTMSLVVPVLPVTFRDFGAMQTKSHAIILDEIANTDEATFWAPYGSDFRCGLIGNYNHCDGP